MYSLVNTTISLSFKGKNAERQLLSDVVSAMDWQTIGDSVRSYRYQYNRLICEVIGDAIYIIINLAAATQGKDVAHQVVAVLRDISV